MSMRPALVAIAALLLMPSVSLASTAAVELRWSRVPYHVVVYDAAPGEANDLTTAGPSAVVGPGAGVVLTDTGAAITPGEGCVPIAPNSVSCAHPDGITSVEAELRDQEDHFMSNGPHFVVRGGPANDVLEGGEGFGTLEGGAGDDLLSAGHTYMRFKGGTGKDTMIGSDEDDSFLGGSGADTIDGRGESDYDWSTGDMVSYVDHRAPVTVDLSRPAAAAGSAGEGDSLSDVESVNGGQGADTLTARRQVSTTEFGSRIWGDGGADLIRGGPGRDDVQGGRGDDFVYGGRGDDAVGGQGGRDTLSGGGGTNAMSSDEFQGAGRDFVRCGDAGYVWPGNLDSPILDLIDQSCGRIDPGDYLLEEVAYRYVGDPTRAVASTLTCRYPCHVTIALRARGKLLGTAQRRLRRDEQGTLTVPLGAEARDELARTGVLNVGYSMDFRWGETPGELDERRSNRWRLLLHE
jgi:Ca2+-binding RTX toxin-like protein